MMKFYSILLSVLLLAGIPKLHGSASDQPQNPLATDLDPVWSVETIMEWAESADMRRIDDLILALEDKDGLIRQAAGHALRRMTGEMFFVDARCWRNWWEEMKRPSEDTATLIRRLSDPRDDARRRTFWKLAHKGDDRSMDILFELWINREGDRS